MNLSRHLPRWLQSAIVRDLKHQLVYAGRALTDASNKYHAAALELDLAKGDIGRLQGANNLLRQEVELLDKACAKAGAEVESISAENLRLYHDRKVLRHKLDKTVLLMDESATAMNDARQQIAESNEWIRRAVPYLQHYMWDGHGDASALLDSSPLTDTPSPAGASHGGSKDAAGGAG